jgi:bifunctional DNA-binding transcriptional regulator/antitoxin component of YhaV-PrlF toxin-antitoxin module
VASKPIESITVGRQGEINLPRDLKERYGFAPEQLVRVIGTRYGVLLIPLSDDPPSAELQQELQAWQELGISSWNDFLY